MTKTGKNIWYLYGANSAKLYAKIHKKDKIDWRPNKQTRAFGQQNTANFVGQYSNIGRKPSEVGEITRKTEDKGQNCDEVAGKRTKKGRHIMANTHASEGLAS